MFVLERLPTSDFLSIRGINIQPDKSYCQWFHNVLESVEHIFIGCPTICSFWYLFLDWWGITGCLQGSLFDFIIECLQGFSWGKYTAWWRCCWAAAAWTLWLTRNEMIFQDKQTSITDVLFLVKLRSYQWILAVDDSIQIQENLWWECPTKCSPSFRPKLSRAGIAW